MTSDNPIYDDRLRVVDDQETGSVSVVFPIVMLFVCLGTHSFLSEKLADTDGFPRLFNYSYGLMLFALSLTVVYWGTVAVALGVVWSRWRFRLLLCLANSLFLSSLVVIVLTKLGAILVMALSAGTILCIAVSTRERTIERFQKLLPASVIVFVSLYFGWALSELFLRGKPEFVGGGGGGNPALRKLYDGRYGFNALGLRGPELPPAGTDTAHRILVVGDSFAFGQGVEDEQTFPVYLEKFANQRFPQQRFRVINAGRSGTNTQDQMEYLRQRDLQVEPDSIVVQFYLNDLEVDAETDSAPNWLIDQMLNQPLRSSYTLFFLKDRCERLILQCEASAFESSPAEIWMQGLLGNIHEEGEGWLAFEAAVEQFGSLQRELGIPVHFVLYPHPGLESALMREIHQRVADKIREFDLSVVDLVDAFDPLDLEEQKLSETDHHPSAAMHQLAASFVWRTLAGRGMCLSGCRAADRAPYDGCNPQSCKDDPACCLPSPVAGENQDQE